MQFDDDWWWSDAYNEVHFRGRDDDGSAILFRITQEALTDYFQTADTSEGAQALFDEERDFIEQVALLVLNDNNDSDEILITYQLFSQYARQV